ncbi:aromatic amino acid transport family protein [Escherichia coli]
MWAVIIPAVLAIKARRSFPIRCSRSGAELIPAIVILFGITVILCWFGNVFNVLPKFG